jgi:uncharacterized protein (DUF1501 family)
MREILALDPRVGLHPNLRKLRERTTRGGVALFEGVGYPHPNRSHFSSLDIWHAGDLRGRTPARAGSAGSWTCSRILRRRRRARGPEPIVRAALALARADHAIELDGAPRRRSGHVERRSGFRREGERWERDAGARPARDARRELVMAELHAALERNRVPRDYNYSSFSQDLSTVAGLIHADVGVRVCSLELEGFDTHADQRKRHDRLMTELDAGLDAFLSDLRRSQRGRETVVLVYSEFGRRVEENGSGGTDHGAASVAMALGEPVRGGLYGAPPALDALDDGDLAFTTDFRSLYGR